VLARATARASTTHINQAVGASWIWGQSQGWFHECTAHECNPSGAPPACPRVSICDSRHTCPRTNAAHALPPLVSYSVAHQAARAVWDILPAQQCIRLHMTTSQPVSTWFEQHRLVSKAQQGAAICDPPTLVADSTTSTDPSTSAAGSMWHPRILQVDATMLSSTVQMGRAGRRPPASTPTRACRHFLPRPGC
jgi:hypothetical protein